MNPEKTLKIILSNKGASSGHQKKPITGESVNVTCPEHLTLSNLPVAKTIGKVPSGASVRNIGSIVQRKPGAGVHICVSCDYPIAIYGRLIPCEHAFCLDCAKSNSKCTICKEPIMKIQSIKMGGGIFICGMLTCLKSFLVEDGLKSHIKDCHGVAGSASSNNGSGGELQ